MIYRMYQFRSTNIMNRVIIMKKIKFNCEPKKSFDLALHNGIDLERMRTMFSKYVFDLTLQNRDLTGYDWLRKMILQVKI